MGENGGITALLKGFLFKMMKIFKTEIVVMVSQLVIIVKTTELHMLGEFYGM